MDVALKSLFEPILTPNALSHALSSLRPLLARPCTPQLHAVLTSALARHYHRISHGEITLDESELLKFIAILTEIVSQPHCLPDDLLVIFLWSTVAHIKGNSVDCVSRSILNLMEAVIGKFTDSAVEKIYPAVFSLMSNLAIKERITMKIPTYALVPKILGLIVTLNKQAFTRELVLGQPIPEFAKTCQQRLCGLLKELNLVVGSVPNSFLTFLKGISWITLNRTNLDIFKEYYCLFIYLDDQQESPFELSPAVIAHISDQYRSSLTASEFKKASNLAPYVQFNEQLFQSLIGVFSMRLRHQLVSVVHQNSTSTHPSISSTSTHVQPVPLETIRQQFLSEQKKLFSCVLSHINYSELDKLFLCVTQLPAKTICSLIVQLLGYLQANPYSTCFSLTELYSHLSRINLLSISLAEKASQILPLDIALRLWQCLIIQNQALVKLEPTFRQEELLVANLISIAQKLFHRLQSVCSPFKHFELTVCLTQRLFFSLLQPLSSIRLIASQCLLSLCQPNQKLGDQLRPISATLMHRNRSNLGLLQTLITISPPSASALTMLAEWYLLAPNNCQELLKTFLHLLPSTALIRKCLLKCTKWYRLMTPETCNRLNMAPIKDLSQHPEQLFHGNDKANVSITNALGVIMIELKEIIFESLLMHSYSLKTSTNLINRPKMPKNIAVQLKSLENVASVSPTIIFFQPQTFGSLLNQLCLTIIDELTETGFIRKHQLSSNINHKNQNKDGTINNGLKKSSNQAIQSNQVNGSNVISSNITHKLTEKKSLQSHQPEQLTRLLNLIRLISPHWPKIQQKQISDVSLTTIPKEMHGILLLLSLFDTPKQPNPTPIPPLALGLTLQQVIEEHTNKAVTNGKDEQIDLQLSRGNQQVKDNPTRWLIEQISSEEYAESS